MGVDEHLRRHRRRRTSSANEIPPLTPRALRGERRSRARGRSRSSPRARGRRRRRRWEPPARPEIRAPERGSARTGQPKAAARRRTTSGRPAPAPATIRPFAPGRARPTRASSVPGSGTLRTGSARCQGRPLRRPAGRSPGRFNKGSRNARLACTGPGPIGPAVASATRRLASDRQVRRAASSGTPGSTAQRRAPANKPGLFDGLRGADVMELGRPVGRANDHRHPGQVGLHDGGVDLGRRRPARGEENRRPAGGEPDPEGEEGRRALVEAHMQGDAALPGEGDRERGGSRARGYHGVGQPRAHPLVDERGREASRYGHPRCPSFSMRPGPGTGRGSCSCTASPRRSASWARLAGELEDSFEVVDGRSARSRRLSVPLASSGLDEAADALGETGGQAIYVGYSLGGRLLSSPRPRGAGARRASRHRRGAPGICDEASRLARRLADDRLAADLEEGGDGRAWRNSSTNGSQGPLFAHLSGEQADRPSRLANTAAGLAASLRTAGTGTQSPLWERLSATRDARARRRGRPRRQVPADCRGHRRRPSVETPSWP